MAFPFTVYIDKELKLIHLPDCPGTKMPSKYGYGEIKYVRNLSQAQELDKKFKACERCHAKIKAKSKDTGKQYNYKRDTNQGKVWD